MDEKTIDKAIAVDHVECEDGTAGDHLQASKVLHKVDRRLLPVLALLYLIAFLDRGNLGNAKARELVRSLSSILTSLQVAGMNKDLHLTGKQFNLCASVKTLATTSRFLAD